MFFSLMPHSSISRIRVDLSFPSLFAISRSFFMVSRCNLRLIVSDNEITVIQYISTVIYKPV